MTPLSIFSKKVVKLATELASYARIEKSKAVSKK